MSRVPKPPADAHHSALRDPLDAPRASYFEWRGNIALQHDLILEPKLPPAFDACDVLYLEPPWQAGFTRFNERAGVTDARTYTDLIAAISTLIRNESRPVVLLTGRHAVKAYPPANPKPALINGYAFIALAYRMPLPAAATDADLLAALARRHARVGDPVCGYGRTARAFTAAGKAWTVSDYNATCIGYIAQTAATWPAGAQA